MGITVINWAVDEAIIKLVDENKMRNAIVVAIWNTPHRLKESRPK
jgi:hypothetical protein